MQKNIEKSLTPDHECFDTLRSNQSHEFSVGEIQCIGISRVLYSFRQPPITAMTLYCQSLGSASSRIRCVKGLLAPWLYMKTFLIRRYGSIQVYWGAIQKETIGCSSIPPSCSVRIRFHYMKYEFLNLRLVAGNIVSWTSSTVPPDHHAPIKLAAWVTRLNKDMLSIAFGSAAATARSPFQRVSDIIGVYPLGKKLSDCLKVLLTASLSATV